MHTYPEVMFRASNYSSKGHSCLPDRPPTTRALDFNSASNLYADAEEVGTSHKTFFRNNCFLFQMGHALCMCLAFVLSCIACISGRCWPKRTLPKRLIYRGIALTQASSCRSWSICTWLRSPSLSAQSWMTTQLSRITRGGRWVIARTRPKCCQCHSQSL